MFGLFNRQIYTNEDDLIRALMRISCFGFGNEKDFEKDNMLKVLSEVESRSANLQNPKLAYWLGIAWRNFTSWHIRGNERKKYFERVINYFDKALNLSKNTLPLQLPLEKRHNSEYLDQIDIAGELGFLLVDEALTRDLDRAEKILRFVYENTAEYEPCLCAYAELYYKKGGYEKCEEIALNIHDRATKSAEWKSDPPPAPVNIAGKAYRALGKAAKKMNHPDEAIKWFQKIKKLGVATENDLKILNKLRLA